jgi:hypothetical protein
MEPLGKVPKMFHRSLWNSVLQAKEELFVLQVGCPEFTLLVVLLCAGAAQQQMQALHAYAGSISRVFLGKQVSWTSPCAMHNSWCS